MEAVAIEILFPEAAVSAFRRISFNGVLGPFKSVSAVLTVDAKSSSDDRLPTRNPQVREEATKKQTTTIEKQEFLMGVRTFFFVWDADLYQVMAMHILRPIFIRGNRNVVDEKQQILNRPYPQKRGSTN
jgi:hypothetical protein